MTRCPRPAKRCCANRVDRETFRLAEFSAIGGLVPFRQVEGILRSRGWRVHRLDRWDGGDHGPAYREEPSSGFRITVELTGDIATHEGPFRCQISEPIISFGRLDPGDPRLEVLISEALRDLALGGGQGHTALRIASSLWWRAWLARRRIGTVRGFRRWLGGRCCVVARGAASRGPGSPDGLPAPIVVAAAVCGGLAAQVS
jgi:hypothetical protein